MIEIAKGFYRYQQMATITNPHMKQVECVQCGKAVYKIGRIIDVSGWYCSKYGGKVAERWCPACGKEREEAIKRLLSGAKAIEVVQLSLDDADYEEAD